MFEAANETAPPRGTHRLVKKARFYYLSNFYHCPRFAELFVIHQYPVRSLLPVRGASAPPLVTQISQRETAWVMAFLVSDDLGGRDLRVSTVAHGAPR